MEDKKRQDLNAPEKMPDDFYDDSWKQAIPVKKIVRKLKEVNRKKNKAARKARKQGRGK